MIEISAFAFLDTMALYGLLLVPLIALLLYIFERSRARRLARLLPGSGGIGARFARIAAPTLVAAVLLLAAARPYDGYEDIPLPRPGRDIMIVFDVSQSMLAKDQSPSRLEFAKRKISDLIDALQMQAGGERLGIVLFAGEAYLFAPLTSDHAVLRHFVKAINGDLIMSRGSSIESAFEIALKSLDQVDAHHPRILLLTDGEDNALNSSALEDRLKGAAVPVDVLGFGTPEGAPIEAGGGLLVDRRGSIVHSKLNEDVLQRAASVSGGLYQRASPADGDLQELLTGYKRSAPVEMRPEGWEGPRSFTVYNEIGHWLIWGGASVLILCMALGRRSLVFCITALALAIPRVSSAEAPAPESMHQAYAAYNSGEFERALPQFEARSREAPDDLNALQALASTYYKIGRFTEAETAFSRLQAKSKTGRQNFDATYNLGNAAFMQKKFEAAVENYGAALKIKPGDADAEHNLRLARKLLEEKRRKEEAERKKKEEEESKRQEEQQQQQENSQDGEAGAAPTPSPDEENSQKQSGTGESEEEKNEGSSGNKGEKDEPGDKNQEKDTKPADGGEEKEKETAAEQNESSAQSAPRASKPMDKAPLLRSEAEKWLDSLSDAPILYFRKAPTRRRQEEQTW